MIPKLIHFVGPKDLNERQRYLIELARRLHPDWDLHVWNDEWQFENKTLARYHGKCSVGAQRGDLIRLEVVWVHGGIYLDTDIRLLRSLEYLIETEKMVCCSEDGNYLTNAFFAAPPRNSAIGSLIEGLIEEEPDWERPANETTGPQFFSTVLRYRDDIMVLPRETFYPYNWNEPPLESYLPAVSAVHEWAGSWKEPRPTASKPIQEKKRSTQSIVGASGRRMKPLLQRIVKAALPDGFARLLDHQPSSYAVTERVVTLTRHSIKMVVPGADLKVAPSLILRGEYEPHQEAFVASVIKGGDWMIDVGANVGLFSLLAARRCGPFGRVFAIEPNAELCACIEQSAYMNQYHDRVIVINGAIGDFHGDGRKPGEKGVEGSNLRGDKARLVLGNMFPLDVPIKLMKIDIEGCQVKTLRGARRLFEKQCIEHLLLDVSADLYGARSAELMEELRRIKSLGYALHTITGAGELRRQQNDEVLYPFLRHQDVVFKLEAKISI